MSTANITEIATKMTCLSARAICRYTELIKTANPNEYVILIGEYNVPVNEDAIAKGEMSANIECATVYTKTTATCKAHTFKNKSGEIGRAVPRMEALLTAIETTISAMAQYVDHSVTMDDTITVS